MSADKAPTRGGGARLAAIGVVAVAAWAGGFYFRMAPPGAPLVRAEAVPPPSSTPPPTTSTPAPVPSEAATASLTTSQRSDPADAGGLADAALDSDAATDADVADAATDGSSDAATETPSTAPADITACVVSLLPEDTFDAYQPDFEFVCTSKYARQSVTQLQSEISKGKWGSGTATLGMKEWAALGWYQLAVLSLMRGKCCAEPAELEWTFRLACPIDEAMADIEAAIRTQDRAAANKAIQSYTQATTCLTKLGQARNFGQKGMPGPGLAALQRFVDRVSKVDGT